jgi:hypothetical protein
MKMLLVASAVAATSLFAASGANAACRQQFSHTTCSGFGPWQKCVNHNKTVCDAPRIETRVAPQPPQNRVAIQPNAGGRLIGNDGSTLAPNNSNGILSNANAAAVPTNAGRLVSDRGGAIINPANTSSSFRR